MIARRHLGLFTMAIALVLMTPSAYASTLDHELHDPGVDIMSERQSPMAMSADMIVSIEKFEYRDIVVLEPTPEGIRRPSADKLTVTQTAGLVSLARAAPEVAVPRRGFARNI